MVEKEIDLGPLKFLEGIRCEFGISCEFCGGYHINYSLKALKGMIASSNFVELVNGSWWVTLIKRVKITIQQYNKLQLEPVQKMVDLWEAGDKSIKTPFKHVAVKDVTRLERACSFTLLRDTSPVGDANPKNNNQIRYKNPVEFNRKNAMLNPKGTKKIEAVLNTEVPIVGDSDSELLYGRLQMGNFHKLPVMEAMIELAGLEPVRKPDNDNEKHFKDHINCNKTFEYVRELCPNEFEKGTSDKKQNDDHSIPWRVARNTSNGDYDKYETY
jgi:hypothetical protein